MRTMSMPEWKLRSHLLIRGWWKKVMLVLYPGGVYKT